MLGPPSGLIVAHALRAGRGVVPPPLPALRFPSASGLVYGTELRAGRKPMPVLNRSSGLSQFRVAERA